MKRLVVLAILAGAVAVGTARAQEPVLPGLDPMRLRVGVDTLSVFLLQSNDTIRTGFVVDEVTHMEEDGRSLFHRAYQSEDGLLGFRQDTLVSERETLSAVRYGSHADHSQHVVEFAAGRARGWMRLGGTDSIAIDLPVTPGAYAAGSFDLLVRSAPLQDGWSTVIRAFAPAAQAEVPLGAYVAGVETILGVTCWKVEGDLGETAVTFWISQDTRELLQELRYLGPNVRVLIRRTSAGD